MLMVSIDSTIVLLAFPSIVSSLHSNLATIIWVILIYMLVSTVATTQFGRVGDIYGRSKIFIVGIVVFTVASLLCGLAPSDVALIGFRLVQGVGGAMISATSAAIIADTFERQRIGRAFGYTALAFNVGSILGIVLGGIITTFVGWQYIFFINIPIGLVAFFLALRYISDKQVYAARLDVWGMALLTIALTLLLFGGIELAAVGPSAINAGLVILGFILCGAFYVVEKRSENPTIHFDMFENPVFRNSIFASLLQGLGFLGVVFMLIMYLQGVRGFSPLYASLLLVPGYVLSGILSPFMGRVADRQGARIVATLGIVLQILGVVVYLTLGMGSSIYIVIIGSVIMSVGGAMFWPSNSSAVMAHADPKKFGVASGLMRLFSGMGMMGSFIIVFVVASLSIPRAEAFQIFVGSSKISSSVGGAFIEGMHVAFVAMIVLLIVAGIISLTRGKEDRSAHAQAQVHYTPKVIGSE